MPVPARRAAVRWALLAVMLLAALPAGFARAQEGATPVPTTAHWWNGATCYEIFVRSFADSDGDGIGDFNGLTAKLDYLNDGDPSTTADLGVDCVWLMPVFKATSYHGYDVEDYFAIEPDYGTEADFDRFVAAAHERGIRVILDLVLNHTSVEHPWFQEALKDPNSPYRDWYIFSPTDPGYVGPWGEEVWHRTPDGSAYYYGVFWSGMPDLNYRSPAVTAEAEKISSFWIGRGVDGFRLDAIKHLIEDGKVQENTPETHDWLRGYRAFLDQTAPDVFTIGEIFNAGSSLLKPYYPDQLHAYFDFELAGQLLIAGQQGVGDGLAYLVGEAVDKQPGAPWGTFLTNHDQNRAMTQLGGDVVAAKLAATGLLTLPGIPFVYYGEEIGMTGAKPDERIRTPMQWTAEPGAGFTTGTPWQPLQMDTATVNVGVEAADPDSLLNHYRALIQLRAAHPALASGGFVQIETGSRTVLAFLRTTPEETVLVVINFGKEDAAGLTLSLDASALPPGARTLTPLFGADAPATLAVGDGGALAGRATPFTVPARSAVVYAID